MNSSPVTFDGHAGRLAADRWTGEGDRGDLVMLHGGGQTRHSWSRSGPRFAAAGWTTYAIDLRGHGDSAWDAAGDYSMDRFVDDLLAVVEQIGRPPVLVGASLGGITSLLAEGEHAPLSRALVLVDIATRIEPAGTERIRAFMTGAPDGFASLEEAADAIAAYNPHRPRPSRLDGLRKNLRQGTDGRWRWHWDPSFLQLNDEARRETVRSGSRLQPHGSPCPRCSCVAARPTSSPRRAPSGCSS